MLESTRGKVCFRPAPWLRLVSTCSSSTGVVVLRLVWADQVTSSEDVEAAAASAAALDDEYLTDTTENE